MHRRLYPLPPHLRWRALCWGAAAFLLSGVVLGVMTLAYAYFLQGRIVQGITVSGIPVGFLSRDEARAFLDQEVQLFSARVALSDGVETIRTPLAALGASILLDDALEEAYQAGRRGKTIRENVAEVLSLRRQPRDISLRIAFDEEEFNRYLAQAFVGGMLERPATNASVEFDEARVSVIPAQAGNIIGRAKLKIDLANRLARLDAAPIFLTMVRDEPAITTAAAEAAKVQLERILAHSPYFLFGNGKRFVIPSSQVAEWLTITRSERSLAASLDNEEIRAFLLGIAPAITQEPRNAVFSFDDKKRLLLEMPSEDAARLDVAATVERLRENMLALRRSTDAALDTAPAPLNERRIRELGVTHLLGAGSSNFAGSSASRVRNIRVSAEKYRGALIEPGAEFSFNAYLGTIDERGGYVPELVIKGKKLIPEYGGGICQVSTTLFRAAVRAGLKITERVNHSIPVRYYNPQGFDATVYPPSPDLKFVNSTTGTILVQPRITGTTLSFELYGAPDGRAVTVEGPRVVERNVDGSMKTVLTQKVTKNGEVVLKKSFWSFYKSPALYKTERNPLE